MINADETVNCSDGHRVVQTSSDVNAGCGDRVKPCLLLDWAAAVACVPRGRRVSQGSSGNASRPLALSLTFKMPQEFNLCGVGRGSLEVEP